MYFKIILDCCLIFLFFLIGGNYERKVKESFFILHDNFIEYKRTEFVNSRKEHEFVCSEVFYNFNISDDSLYRFFFQRPSLAEFLTTLKIDSSSVILYYYNVNNEQFYKLLKYPKRIRKRSKNVKSLIKQKLDTSKVVSFHNFIRSYGTRYAHEAIKRNFNSVIFFESPFLNDYHFYLNKGDIFIYKVDCSQYGSTERQVSFEELVTDVISKPFEDYPKWIRNSTESP